ncbi:MAG: aminoacyl-tRNA hydrolase [Lentisphaerota bacterium]
MKLIAGLGNPGKRYEHTRHNVGFDVVEALARKAGTAFKKGWFSQAEMARMRTEAGQELLLVKPHTFMNRSGVAIAPLLRKKGLEPDSLIVVVDDADLEAGQLRIRKKGSAGGHNGLKSVIQELGTEDFVRVRVGIGRQAGADMVDHVLTRFSAEARRSMEESIARAADAVLCIVEEGADAAMNRFNAAPAGAPGKAAE